MEILTRVPVLIDMRWKCLRVRNFCVRPSMGSALTHEHVDFFTRGYDVIIIVEFSGFAPAWAVSPRAARTIASTSISPFPLVRHGLLIQIADYSIYKYNERSGVFMLVIRGSGRQSGGHPDGQISSRGQCLRERWDFESGDYRIDEGNQFA